MMKKVVITGSSGRIGRALHWKLSQDHEVTGIDITPSPATTRLVDIRDEAQLLRVFEGADTLFHAAALHAPHVGIATEKAFYDLNVGATEKICRAAIASGVSQIVFTSTTALYGYANAGEGSANWINEQTIPAPKTIYHQTKWEAEQVLKAYAGKDLAVRILRMSRCFPEPAHLMAVYRLHRGIDYRDVADAHLSAAQLTKELPFDVYVISGETPFLPSDCQPLFEHPEAVIRARCPRLAQAFDQRGWKFPDSIDRVYDASYAAQALGWKSSRGPLEVIRQLDDQDFEVLPPA
ncbi:MAG: NAD(P)-dependent oxidoreductase [Bacteroidia bacterium]|nr:NAD(P)-dependent oxidoreductase [Bacteroidia bacterium]